MTKYLLPTLISLALSGYAFADEEAAAPGTPEAAPPIMPEMAVPPDMQAPNDPQASEMMAHHKEMMEKHMAHQGEMRALQQQMHQTTDIEERQKLMEQLRAKQKEMRDAMIKERSNMRPPPMPERGEMMMPPQRPYGNGNRPGFGNSPGFGPGWGGHGPRNGPRNDYNRMPYGAAPNFPRQARGGYPEMPYGGPNFPGPMRGYPEMPYRGAPNFPGQARGGYYDMPYSAPNFPKGPTGPRSFNQEKKMGHHARMEQRLENIENLMKELVELLKEKQQ